MGLNSIVLYRALIILGITSLAAKATERPASERVDFNFQIRPILSDRCFKCHGPDPKTRKADMRLDTAEGALAARGKKSELRAIVPGKPEKSELVRRLLSVDPDEQMPPPDSNLKISSEEIALIRKWIEEGAEYKTHWAFLAPKKISVPKIKNDWAQNSIDRFVLARLQRENLQPVPQATKETLIRRLAFDLTGLPPSLKQVDDFLKDTSPHAYKKLVEQFLASTAYGEHMANDWLDLARYADTYGYQSDVDRDMSAWRDWVIGAFNKNLSYNKFILWQIAGDLFPDATDEQILATAFNRLHRQTNEGGSIEEEFRNEYVSDRVHTFGTAFLGLTLECARCHDHKYDPIKQKDYYRLSAFFNNIDESGLYSHFTHATPSPTLLLYKNGEKEKHAALKKQISEQEMKLKRVEKSAKENFARWEDKLRVASASGGCEIASGLKKTKTVFTHPPEADATHDNSLPTGLLQYTDHPVAHFSFEQIADGKTPDVYGKIQASLVENPKQVEGRIGNALKFDGENSVVSKGIGDFKRTDPFSFALWLKPTEKQKRAVIFHHSRSWTDAGSRGYQLILEDAKPNFALIHFWPGNAISIRAKESLPQNEWTHLAITYDGSSRAAGLKIFLNGQIAEIEIIRDNLFKDILYRSEWGDADVGNIPLTLAARFRDSGFKNGLIDEFEVFDRCLTGFEVKAHFKKVVGQEVVGRDSVEQNFERSQGSRASIHSQTNKRFVSLASPAATDKARRSLAPPNENKDLFSLFLNRVDPEYQNGLAELKKLRDAENNFVNDIREIMVMKEMTAHRPTFVLKRGAYDAPGDAVESGTPEGIFPFPKKYPKNRLGLARWLVDPRNPLTARVVVNRIWKMHFGRGLVATPEDFGSQGQLPTHPELLDWLAKNFVESGWNVKKLHELIVTSATYRQSSVAPPELVAADPDNRLLARGPKHRLQAEEIRDAALATSGLLSPKIGGPSVKPYQPAGLWEQSGTGKTYAQDKGEKLYRRSLYTFWRRTAPPPSMLTFDAMSREVCTARREPTTTPLQALVLLNDPQFIEAGRVLAEKILREKTDDLNSCIENVFRLVIGRIPQAREREILRQLYQEQLEIFTTDGEAAKKYLATGEHSRDTKLPEDEVAAMTVLINTLMNHDEFVMER